ncbi:hypothetical protein [Longimicrobium terrae]|uniref:Lipoprotein n=1 Tax=Longimicrobium terrae TaxID=1639882 RepID=A0A841H0I4_9BACT|nr:hypothetical protein [Longimicrobium terrae]MBB4637216.1 hypothetical protein [Longimicrobium terrae]MBB6071523.1 hypothetical protein [Longimicrobium terrae]NNC30056.1 hypothetical protein [Longimicrobium terrae]
MKRTLLFVAVSLTAAGCSDSRVVVRANLAEGGEPVADMPVYLLPYDRVALMDSLEKASDTTEPTIPAELLQQLQRLNAAPPASGDSVARMAALQKRQIQARIDSIRGRRRAWRDEVFAPFDSLAKNKGAELGVPAVADTTDKTGRAAVPAEAGTYWVYASYVLPGSTLEWNIRVKMPEDQDSIVVPLSRANAKERPFY